MGIVQCHIETAATPGIEESKQAVQPTVRDPGQQPDSSTSPSPVVRLLLEVGLKSKMEKEEKRLLKEQLQSLQVANQAETSRLQEELGKEELKEKQENFQQLQMRRKLFRLTVEPRSRRSSRRRMKS